MTDFITAASLSGNRIKPKNVWSKLVFDFIDFCINTNDGGMGAEITIAKVLFV